MANLTLQTASNTQSFAPDWVSPPGDTILDLLEQRDWTQTQLAESLGYSNKHVSLLINGKVPLSEDAAIRLQNVLGAPAGFWLMREAQYRQGIASIEAAEQNANRVAWLDQFPIKVLMDAGVLDKCRVDAKNKPHLVGKLLAFFGVATPAQWQRLYGDMPLAFHRNRKAQSNMGALSAWLRLGEQAAEKLMLDKSANPKYDEARLRANLPQIRALTT